MSKPTYIAYLPHGVNEKYFFPIEEGTPTYKDYVKYKTNFDKDNPNDFVILWNNRNIRRKQPGDVILAYKTFCDKLSAEQAKRVYLFMHTAIIDENGTDLLAVKDAICPNYNIIFSKDKIPTAALNFYYNLADVTVNIASNEGFGISGIESLMAGTPIINNVTGGLQDHCRFEDEKGNWINFNSEFTSNHTGQYRLHGQWVKPVFPTSRSLQGSPITPYIFDDRCKYEDVADALMYWYSKSREERKAAGLKGREWVLSDESKMSAKAMCESFKKHLSFIIENNVKPDKFSLEKVQVQEIKQHKHLGITL